MRERFVVEGLNGQKKLQGEIAVRGAKNAVLKILPATVLFADEVELQNVPHIEDVDRMRELLEGLKTNQTILRKDIAERFRASIVLTGPVLARYGAVEFPFPGGCVLGERAIDLFLNGFKAMGASVVEDDSYFKITANGKLKGAHIIFPLVSVTATETLMMAAVLAEGETIIENAAMEPEIGYLAEFLNSCGAQISGMNTPVLRIQGGELLRAEGKPFVVPPDRIETGSFAILAALAGKDVTITNCDPSWLNVPLSLLAQAGVLVETTQNTIRIRGASEYRMVPVRTHEYPGFPTDLQAPMAVFMSQCAGEGSILETIFDGRFRYVDDLVVMGADMTVMNPHRILIRGPKKLTRKNLESPDLRGGLAYLLAATVAEGTSTIDNAYLIDRGYERIEERLSKLGLSIKRETSQ
ncbi:MAG: UDP-N-acetylglucosamine 1-carboxyvinyltransferase [Patescibacteria group bacterium]|jgi:UDP-N-acetylglucosamine 1-carboxyvinyltransferase|nr:UDP-N-acetylglucosamine 1-carboxyvinyltransferase [Patescibacteria group bacterium]